MFRIHWPGHSKPDLATPARVRTAYSFVLAFFIFLTFPGIALGLRTFYFRDFGYFGYPFAFYFRERFWQGELPLWNPFNNAGIPFLAQWSTLVLYPPSLVYLLFPLPWSLNLFCLLHLFLGGIGMYRLARDYSGTDLGGAVAATGFVFSAFSLNCLVWPHTIAALAWTPWIIVLSRRALSHSGREVAVAALAGGLQMLTGAPEIILLTWLVVCVFSMADVWHDQVKPRRRVTRMAAIVVMVAGLAAAQLLPFFDLLRHSHRDTSFGDSAWAIPPWGLLNLIAPLFRTYRTPQGIFFQFNQDWISSYYPGVVILVLALAGIHHYRDRFSRILLGITLLSLWLALGDAGLLYGWLHRQIPLLGFMRYPVKFVALASFCFPLLAAHAISRICLPANPQPVPKKTLAGIIAFFTLALAASLFISYRYPLYQESVADSGPYTLTRLIFLLLTSVLILRLTQRPPRAAPPDGNLNQPAPDPGSPSPAVTIFPELAATSRSQLPVRSIAIAFLFSSLIWLDLCTYAPRQNPTASPAIYLPRLSQLEQLQPRPRLGLSRASVSREAYESFYRTMLPDPDNDYLVHRLGLFSNCNLLDQIPVTDGFYSLHLKESREIWSSIFYAQPGTPPDRLLDFLGVSHRSSPTNALFLQRRSSFLPLATLGQEPIFAGAEETLGALSGNGFDPKTKVYLPVEAKGVVGATNAVEGQVIIKHFGTHKIELEADAQGPGLVVIAQSFHPAWKASVDSKPVRLWRANHAFQAVEIPQGPHTIQLVYSDPFFRAGVVISLLTLALSLFIVFRKTERRATRASIVGGPS